jgi:uncharacterized protein YecE (DUF72 family)
MELRQRGPLRRFFAPLKPLKKKLGPVLFQLPPNWNKNGERLETFVKALPSGHRYAFELRDPRWISNQAQAGLDTYCYFDNDQKAFAPQNARELVLELGSANPRLTRAYTK